MIINELDLSREAAYRKFIDSRADALVYHSLEYRDVLVALSVGRPRYLICEDDSNVIHGILPLFEIEGGRGKVLNSLPYYGSHGGIVASCSEARRRLLGKYNAMATADHVIASTIIANPFNDDDLQDAVFDYVDSRIGQVSDISSSDDHKAVLMSRFHSKTRNAIRKAEKLGVRVTVDNNSMDVLREIHEENMRALGGKAKSALFFQAIVEKFSRDKKYRIYVGWLDGQVAAALLVLFHNEVVEYFTPAVRKEYRESQALSSIILTAMIDASREGFRFWNWGGTWASQKSLHLFKSRWGSEDRPYTYRTKLNDASIKDSTPTQMLEEYPFTYVLPFSELRAG